MSKQFHILLADDNPLDVELTRTALSKIGYKHELTVARDGKEVIDFLTRSDQFANRGRNDPHLILLDIKMPRMDGLEVLRYVKSDPGLRRIPIVMFTSSTELNDINESYELGASGYVVKGVDFDDFLLRMKNLVSFWISTNQFPETVKPLTPA